MRGIGLAALWCAIGVGATGALMRLPGGATVRADGPSPERMVVVAELFTSEGCSSCPAADEVLTRLAGTQPVPGVQVVALGEHVDYWDRLGWRDPFSSAAFSARQSEYASRVFNTGNIYTPQIVIDGVAEAIGSDYNAVRRAIVNASRRPKAAISLTVQPQAASMDVALTIRVPAEVGLTETADALLAIIEDRLTTNVQRGENGGRVLKHSAVVRSLTRVAELSAGDAVLEKITTLPLKPEWRRQNLQVVALLQARQDRRIAGAASAPIQ